MKMCQNFVKADDDLREELFSAIQKRRKDKGAGSGDKDNSWKE